MPPAGTKVPEQLLTCMLDWILSLAVDAGPGCEACGGTACVDLTVDPLHCGDCATSCSSGAA